METKRILFIEELSALIGKAATTIRTCATNAKYQHLIPRPFKLPHSRRLAWYEDDVRTWMAASVPVGPAIQKRRGRPTKLQQVIRERMVRSSEAPDPSRRREGD